MRIRLWPRSLAARTALILVIGLAIVQGGGLAINALDRMELQRLAQARDLATRVMGLYRPLVLLPPEQRQAELKRIDLPPGLVATLKKTEPSDDEPPLPWPAQRVLRLNLQLVPLPKALRPREFRLRSNPENHHLLMGLQLPDETWLDVDAKVPPPEPWQSPNFLVAFVLMTIAAGALTVWAVRRLTLPVRLLAEAADRLGRDVNAPPLPEMGPIEVATAAAAFNTMATRIRRFVQDRTFLLTAIGHDLRTPITRLKLRAEFMEDEEQRRKMLADLDELETMVAAALHFGRDVSGSEPVTPLDLAELARTVLDETSDAEPEITDRLSYEGVDHLTVNARPMAIKRALTNLVTNAIKYGGNARIVLHPPRNGTVELDVEDDGPGIPAEDLDRVFEPFQRLEGSRNRETGGSGLGLPIARNILRAHGGDVVLTNRQEGGARATMLLPI